MAVKNFINLYGTRYDLADGVNIAGEFSASGDYYVSDLVIYQGALYRCIATHEHAAWNSSHFEAVTLGDELNAKGWNHAQLTAYYNAHGIQKVAYPFDRNATYQVKDYATYAGGLYQNKTGVTGTDPSSDTTNWEYVPPVRMPDVTAVANDVTDLRSAMETKAEVDGSYEQMTVGNAEQLVSTVGVDDKTPYLFRTTGGSADVGDRVKLSEITGGSVTWNQLAKALVEGNYNKGPGTAVYNNGTVSFTASVRYGALYSATLAPLVVAHKYLINADIRLTNATSTNTVRIAIGNTGYNQGAVYVPVTQPTDVFANVSGVVAYNPGTNPAYDYLFLQDNRAEVSQIDMKNLMLIDLTQMFGTSIADYIYNLETANAGAGIAQLKAWGFFTKPYYAYDTGSILSVKTTAHREVGFNQWDEVYGTNITIGSYGGNFGSVNYIHVIPGATYHFTTGDYRPGASGIRLAFYDADKNLISSTVHYNANLTIPDNCHYIKFGVQLSLYGSTYKNDICINLHWDGERDGEYEPYEEHSYPLDDVELRGIPKLDANNNLYYDGDTYEADGTVTRKYGIVDLGTLEWVANGSYANTYNGTGLTQYVKPSASSSCTNLICVKYPTYSSVRVGDSNGGIAVNVAGNTIFINDTTVADATALKTALSGVYLVYELATPTTESADPYQETQICNDFGTEEFVDTRTMPIPVGHASMYQSNLRAKLEMAPDSPDGSGDFIVRQTNGTNEYVALSSNETVSGLTTRCPACPTGTDGTFTLKATVSSGSVTYSWESDS